MHEKETVNNIQVIKYSNHCARNSPEHAPGKLGGGIK